MNIIKNIITVSFVALVLASCDKKDVRPVEIIETRTVEVKRLAPIIPKPDLLKMKDVKWIVINKQNANTKLVDGVSYFALDTKNYENNSLNTNSLRMHIQQLKYANETYKKFYD